MQEREDDSNVVFFPLDGTWLSLYPRELLAEDATITADGSGFSGITIAHNVSTNDEVDEVLDEAEAAGGRIIKPAQEVFWAAIPDTLPTLTNTFGKWRIPHSPTNNHLL